MKYSSIVLATAVLVHSVIPASAKVLTYAVYSPDMDLRTTPAYLNIKGTSPATGATSVSFNVPSTGLVSFTFSAECLVVGNGPNLSWADINMIVDGASGSPIPPTGTHIDAFCGTFGQGSQSIQHPSISVVKNMTAGDHTIKIYAAPNRAGALDLLPAYALSQTALVIEQ